MHELMMQLVIIKSTYTNEMMVLLPNFVNLSRGLAVKSAYIYKK